MFLYCSGDNKTLVKEKKKTIPDWVKISWDLVQRRRFMNWDAEVAPNDKFTKMINKKKKIKE